jgi:hypothetical protein
MRKIIIIEKLKNQYLIKKMNKISIRINKTNKTNRENQ